MSFSHNQEFENVMSEVFRSSFDGAHLYAFERAVRIVSVEASTFYMAALISFVKQTYKSFQNNSVDTVDFLMTSNTNWAVEFRKVISEMHDELEFIESCEIEI